MDFEQYGQNSQQPRQRRRRAGKRRLNNKAPIAARLALDPQLRGKVGIVSEDLANDLFQQQALQDVTTSDDGVLYVAIAPHTPTYTSVEDQAWTILPVRIQPRERSPGLMSHSTVLFPESADSLQPFLQALGKVDSSRNSLQAHRSVEIRILDVAPIHLDTIFVTVERHLLRNHDDIQSKFGGGFTNAQGPNGLWGKSGNSVEAKKYSKRAAADAEQRLTAAVREALGAQRIVHTGDVLPLPLPSHPITYAPPPPARISFCEPVSQGLLMSTTRIVLVQARPQGLRAQQTVPSRSALLKQVAEDEADDTSNEQFYSAAEDKPGESGTEMEVTSAAEESETEGSVGSMSDSSDDSLEDMISLSAPELPQPPSGMMSSLTSATPRAGGRRSDGIHTPGSVASNFTSATMRPGRGGGKTFKVEGLLQQVPNEVLHPRPRDDEDVDSFVFVDISTLAKIGCFSGDWVRIEAAEEPQLNMFASLKFGSFNDSPEDSGDWRPVKIFGLSGLPSSKPRYAINHSGERRSSVSQRAPTRLTPSVFVPPLLLGNIENPKYLRISPMTFATPNGSSKPGLLHQMKNTAAKNPPLAKEVTLLKVSTPLSMDRVLQPALFAGLKQYFESRRRILKVVICVDEGLGRAVFSGTAGGDSASQEEDITIRLGQGVNANNAGARKIGVAWFRVGQVAPTTVEELEETGEDQWGGVAVLDPATTRMVQAGSDVSRVPGVLGNGWEYWLGVKTIPKSVHDAPTPHGIVADPPQSFIPSLQQRIRDLLSAATSPRAIQLGMKPVFILLRSQQRHIGKATIATRACSDIGLHTFPIDAYDILTEGGANGGDVKTEAIPQSPSRTGFPLRSKLHRIAD
ncbi:hypothetical protein HAV15_008570 [Penicillium sp. str. |nr:hypothetical protein HAV15_008570 [Penicillium sp. str. \